MNKKYKDLIKMKTIEASELAKKQNKIYIYISNIEERSRLSILHLYQPIY